MSETTTQAIERKRPIRLQFSGGTDFDNDLSLYGLTFDEALKVTALVADMMRERRAVTPTAAGIPGSGE